VTAKLPDAAMEMVAAERAAAASRVLSPVKRSAQRDSGSRDVLFDCVRVHLDAIAVKRLPKTAPQPTAMPTHAGPVTP
jgi:hypothetical protein